MAKQSRKKPLTTKKKMARIERERLINRILYITTIVILSAVVLLVGYALVNEYLIKPSRPVAVVNEVEISYEDFQSRIRLQRLDIISQYLRSAEFMGYFRDNPEFAAQIQSNLVGLLQQLDSPELPAQVLNNMIDEILIKQEAKTRGIEITDEEVDRQVQQAFGYFADGAPTPTDAPTIAPTSTYSATQLALVTPIPTATDFPTPPLDSDTEPTSAPTEYPTPTITPSPTPFTYEAYQQTVEDYFTTLKDARDTTMDISVYYSVSEMQLYSQKLLHDISEDEVETTKERVWARHILVETEEEAKEILKRLDNGEDWSDLAAELSMDTSNKDNGGDLGWFDTETMVPEFTEAAFSAKIGETVGPVETQFGFHIIQILGHETQPLTDSEILSEAQIILDALVFTLRAQADIETIDNIQALAPSNPDLLPDERAIATIPIDQLFPNPVVLPTPIPEE
jgi:parvulin-like peptidyl-prolyl isomerase